MLPLTFQQDIILSAGPRFTFLNRKTGETILADKIIPLNGVTVGSNTVVNRDGNDARLFFCSSGCRESIASYLRERMNQTTNLIPNKDISINFSGVTKIDKTYRLSIGGIEIRGNTVGANSAIQNPNVLIPVLDAIVGNTCVLLDRNKYVKNARKQDLPKFVTTPSGIEYQVVSSFWMRSTPLMSLVLGMARFALHLVAQSTNETGRNYVEKLNSLVSQEDIQKAIKNNDFKLAYKNFKKLEDFIVECAGIASNNYPITGASINEFHYLIKKGINHYFTDEPLIHWIDTGSKYRQGIESFLTKTVKQDMTGPPKPIRNLGEIKMVRFNGQAV